MMKSIILLAWALLVGIILPAKTKNIHSGPLWKYSDLGLPLTPVWHPSCFPEMGRKTGPATLGNTKVHVDLKSGGTSITDMAGNQLIGGYGHAPPGMIHPVRQTASQAFGPLISFYSSWEYLDNGSDQRKAWLTPDSGDKAWKTGPGIFGYGNLNEATKINYGPKSSKKYITTYFRKAIDIADLSSYSSFRANLKRDDGAAVYVNGVEVFRDNLPAGPILFSTLAAVATDDGRTLKSFLISAAAFHKGRNVIAVEIHQAGFSNSDMAFDLELFGNPAAMPRDQTPPKVLNIIRQSPSHQTTNAPSASFRVLFSEPVTGVDKTDFLLTSSKSAGGNIAAVSPYGTHGSTYDVTVRSLDGKGPLRLDLKASGTSIADVAGNAAQGGFSGGQSYTLQQSPAPLLLTRGPYLQMGSTTAVTLRWRTDKASDSQIEVGTSYGTYSRKANNPAPTTEHEIRISDLLAGTRYYYRFGSSTQVLQEEADNYFFTAPPTNNPGKVKIAVLGDCGLNTNDVQSNTLNVYRTYVGQNPAEVLLLLGDNAYDDGTDTNYQTNFFNAYGSTILKNHLMYPTPGNHDYHTTSQTARTAAYFKVFTIPTKGESGGLPSGARNYYSYDWGDIHFISLDSYGKENSDRSRLYDTLGAQVSWLKQDLAANNRPWVIVYWHHPPFTKGSHNSDTEQELTLIRQHVLRILERNGVDLVLTGHSHNYERSYLLKNFYGTEANFAPRLHTVTTSSGRYDGSANSSPYVTSSGKINHGTVYVVAGSAGQSGIIEPTWPHVALPFSDNEGGMLYLEVEQNRLDAKYLRTDGMVWDQFTIMKEVNKTREVPVAAGDSARLTASWVGTYQWSTGDTTRTITVRPDQDAVYQVTDNQKSLKDTYKVKKNTIRTTGSRESAGKQPILLETNSPHIFPTLVTRGTRIKIQTPSGEHLVAEVLDMAGRQVSRKEFNGNTHLDTGGLPLGMYLIRLEGERYLKTQKFLIHE